MNKIYFAFIFLLQILFSINTFSQEPVPFTGKNVVIGKYVSILEDPTNLLDVNSIRESSQFIPSSADAPSLALSKDSYWLKFSIKNTTKDKNLILTVEFPTLDACEFYYPVDGKYVSQTFSDNKPFADRKYKHQNFLFDIFLPTDSTATYYLKVQSSEEMFLPIILGTPQTIAESTIIQDLAWGVFMGLLLVMILYNFFVFISTKDISYLFYVLYTTFIGLTQASLYGYTYRFIFQNSPAFFNKAIVVFPSLAGVFGILFVMSFLQTKQRVPKLHFLFYPALIIYSSAGVLRILGFDHLSYTMVNVSAITTIVVIYTVVIPIALQGYRPAKFYLLAWTVFFAGIVIFVLKLPYNIYTNNTMQIGIAFEVILLSLALADRINIFKAEKEKSQEETLMALKENERIVLEQNVILEKKVTERTVELKASNDGLNKALVDLKEAESQLVESEKMASLGQLTAGIAHEINNPINFITSNVNPLKRDVDILLEAIKVIEDVGLSDKNLDDKQKEIDDYKEEIDYDYLKLEINQLLNGINDGASRTAEIVKGLRVFSRLDEDDLKKADINEGLDSTMVIINNLLNNRIKVVRDYGNIPLIECYPGKLNQVFLNIISNAIYAISKKHGESPTGVLKISTGRDEKNIYVKIEDNGIGMDETAKKKIYEPFFTTKDVGEGTGLGMSIAYNTIKKHNGTIILNSIIGEGTEFVLELPIIHVIQEISVT